MVCVITETEKSHRLLSLSRDLLVSLQSESKDLRTRDAGGTNFSAKAGEDLCPSSVDRLEAKGANSFFLCFFFYVGPQQIG